MELKRIAAEHIIENGKHNPEKWRDRYFIEETELAALQQQLAAVQNERVNLLACQCEGCDESLEESAYCQRCYRKQADELATVTAERDELKEELACTDDLLTAANDGCVKYESELTTLRTLVRDIAPYVASWLQDTYGDEYVDNVDWNRVQATLDAGKEVTGE